jgi:type 1 glutamine amidotransferase
MCNGFSCLLAAVLLTGLPPLCASAGDVPTKNRKIVLIGMNRDHGPGEHEYAAGLAILAECLKQTPGVEVDIIDLGKGFPNDAAFLDKARAANAIVCFLRRAGDLFKKQEHRKEIEALLKKGTGFVCLHWAVEGDKKEGDAFMAALGGYYEPGFSDNPHNTATVFPADPKHPIARGWKPFEARDEFYFKIRLLADARPVIRASLLKGHDKKDYKDQTIGWIYQRKDSQGPLGPGRSFGFTGCHFHINFGIPEFRRLIVNGILWTADVEVPEDGAPVKLTSSVPRVPQQGTNR